MTDHYRGLLSSEEWERVLHEAHESPDIDWSFVIDKYPEAVTQSIVDVQPMQGALDPMMKVLQAGKSIVLSKKKL